MNKTETVKRLRQQKTASIKEQIKELKQLQNGNVEVLAEKIEPLAQALTTLADRTVVETQKMQKANQKKIKELKQETEDLYHELYDIGEVRQKIETAAARMMKAAGTAKKLVSIWMITIALALGLLFGIAAGTGSWTLLKQHYLKSRIMEMYPDHPDFRKQLLENLL